VRREVRFINDMIRQTLPRKEILAPVAIKARQVKARGVDFAKMIFFSVLP
jgi:hypothetical protein